MMKLKTWVCVDCAGILREMNLPVKSVTSSHFSDTELGLIKETDVAFLEGLIMGNYDGKYPLPTPEQSLAYKRSFIYAKYGKKKWFNEKAAIFKNENLNTEGISSSEGLLPLAPKDRTMILDPKELANPNQFNFFGSYQNIHTAPAPETFEDFGDFKGSSNSDEKSLDPYASFNVMEGLKKVEKSLDPYASFNVPEGLKKVEKSLDPYASFNVPEGLKKVEKSLDPYASLREVGNELESIFTPVDSFVAFEGHSFSKTSIWDSHTSTRSLPAKSSSTCVLDDFGDFHESGAKDVSDLKQTLNSAFNDLFLVDGRI